LLLAVGDDHPRRVPAQKSYAAYEISADRSDADKVDLSALIYALANMIYHGLVI